jgi:hypothetical protein
MMVQPSLSLGQATKPANVLLCSTPGQWVITRSVLEAVLSSDEYPPPSLNQVVKRLNYYSPSLLRRQFPELCRAISTRYLNYHQAQIEQKKRATTNLETVFSTSSS